SMTAGRKWRVAMDDALAECRTVFVFWCHHAAASEAVRTEYQEGISLQKIIVPVVMDSTPLTSALDEYQLIDFRGVLIGSHDSLIAGVVSIDGWASFGGGVWMASGHLEQKLN